MKITKEQLVWVGLRLSLGFIMFWAFIDKLFGLGFSTPAAKSWLAGNSPTKGFLGNSVTGPLTDFYHSIAGNPLVDWLFMLGLLLIGLALLLGICLKIAGWSGAVMMLLMWSALLLPKTNPILDDHIIYAIIFLGFTIVPAGNWFGLGQWWSNTKLVKKYGFLK